MYRPNPRGNIRYRLRKLPDTPGKILNGVLPFPIWKVSGRLHDPRPTLLGTLAMPINILHPHHHRTPRFSSPLIGLPQDNSSIANIQLSPMAPNSHTHRKSKDITEPINCLTQVRLGDHRNNSALWHRPIRQHPCSSAIRLISQ